MAKLIGTDPNQVPTNGDLGDLAYQNKESVTIDKLTTNNIVDTGGQSLLGRRNLIINGAMQVAQRGTSFTASGYTLDRWEYNESGATGTITQESFSAGAEEGGCKNYLKAAFSAGNDFAGMIHKVEDVQSLRSGEQFTLSFYAKGTNPAGGEIAVRVRQYFGSGGSATYTTYYDTMALTSSWQRFTITDIYDSISGKTIGTGSYLDITIYQPSTDTSTDAWELNLTGVQLEVGSVATPFEHRSYGEELALCQRYYWNPNNTYRMMCDVASTGRHGMVVNFPVTMRATPTMTETVSSTGTYYNTSGIDGVSSSHFCPWITGNGATGTFYARADILYTADAEL